ncbi:hypothetical protein FOZ62_018708, partial [Perkinsus olseni]
PFKAFYHTLYSAPPSYHYSTARNMGSGEEAALISICSVLGVVTIAFAAWVAYVNKRVHREWDDYAANETNRAATRRRACQALASVRRKCKCAEYQTFHSRQRKLSAATTCTDGSEDPMRSMSEPADVLDLELGLGGGCS